MNKKQSATSVVPQLGVLILFGFMAHLCYGQSGSDNPQPVGAYRVHAKTSFQCVGRPAGYYADVEAGCQVYHMCDGLGRQFSYSCPNTTLFQQRMLICDHWYMVNCSRAESNYAANLLIGQRDKPFVTDAENELRTPRPDLLDRPYAPDYAGESFRNQYKINPPIQNTLLDSDYKKQVNRKFDEPPNRIDHPYSFATHWSTQHPSKLKLTTTAQPPVASNRFNSHTTTPPPPPQYQHSSNIARRRSDQDFVDRSTESNSNHHQFQSDLGVSSSQDSRRSEKESNFENSVRASDVKTPSAHYSTPLLQPDYNNNYNKKTDFVSFKTTPTFQSSTPSSTARSVPSNVAFTAIPTLSTTQQVPSQFTKVSFARTAKPFELSSTLASKKTYSHDSVRGTTKFTQNDNLKGSGTSESRILSRPNAFHSTTDSTSFPPNHNSPPKQTFVPIVGLNHNGVAQPVTDLLPPFESIHIYDDATTQGPAIYYEWKIPASALEPPLFESRSLNDLVTDKEAKSSSSPKTVHVSPKVKIPANGLEPPYETSYDTQSIRNNANSTNTQSLRDKFSHNPFIASALSTTTVADTTETHKSPTPRSIPLELAKNDADISSNHLKTKDNNYLELKKLLFIPDYTFPLELYPAQNSYDKNDSVNSFQIKIPSGHGDKRPWYGENAECPECHPSFVKQGTCEPCVKIR